jgi:hypothetical protein
MPSPPPEATTKRVAALGGRHSIAPPAWGMLRQPRRSFPPQRGFLVTAAFSKNRGVSFRSSERARNTND